MRTVLQWTAVVLSVAASAVGSVQAMAKPVSPNTEPEISALEDQLEQARRALGVEPEAQIKPKRLAQWFNWPNWDNWPNWNNWGNWANWVNW